MSKTRPPVFTRDVAARAGVSPRQVARWVAAGLLVPTFRTPGSTGAFAFDADDVDALLERRQAEVEERAS